MSSLTTHAGEVEREISPPPLARSKERLLSLDIFRGMTLIAMTVVNMPGDHHYTYAPISHVGWNGWTIADLIFPFFIFIVGVAMPYSFAGRQARGDSQRKLFGHILLRSAILFAVGVFMTWYYNFMSGLPRYHLSNIRIFGALAEDCPLLSLRLDSLSEAQEPGAGDYRHGHPGALFHPA